MKARKEIIIAVTAGAAVLAYLTAGAWAALAVVLVMVIFYFRTSIIKFIGEVKVELDKCSWPWDPALSGIKKYKELIESTVVVVISVVLLAGYVTSWDFLLAHVIGAFTGTAITK